MLRLKHYYRRKKILIMFVIKSVHWKTCSGHSTDVKFTDSGIIHVFYTTYAENDKRVSLKMVINMLLRSLLRMCIRISTNLCPSNYLLDLDSIQYHFCDKTVPATSRWVRAILLYSL